MAKIRDSASRMRYTVVQALSKDRESTAKRRAEVREEVFSVLKIRDGKTAELVAQQLAWRYRLREVRYALRDLIDRGHVVKRHASYWLDSKTKETAI